MLINIGTINALLDLSSKLSASHHLANDMTVSQVLSWPGVVEANLLDMEELSQIALELFQKSIDKLCEVRAGEGRSLKAYVEDRLQALRQEVMKSKSIVVSMSAKTKDKLLTRLHELQMDVPEARVEQEIALLLAKLDVSEELDRLETHIAEVSRTLNAEKVTGRRLDFLMQELNREANTLSSKSDSAELTLCAVEMKVLIEQMREQIQNFE
ncbi:Protein YicC [Legionella pneumophila subsp. pneumophila LPE509]|nr:Protein YicC [Legionella pneumophila subsp. pneumophila LPE509]